MYYLVKWIITAGHHISPAVTVKGFKRCCISNTVDGTDDDDMLWDGREVDGNFSSECEDDGGTDCEDGE
jgi:hypothetical protein